MPLTIILPSLSFTPSSVSFIDFGLPGKFKIKHFLRITPTCLERMAVGTNAN